MKGTQGSAIIKLGQSIRPTAFSLDHTRLVPKDLLLSAPKDVIVSVSPLLVQGRRKLIDLD